MPGKNIFSRLTLKLFESFLSVNENSSRELGAPKRFIIIRQHNQLGDLLAGVSLFRAIKENYPASHITLIVSPFNYPGMVKNKYLDRIVVFDKTKLFNVAYTRNLFNILREQYDVAIVPVVVSISFTSNLLARLSNASIRIGCESLDGKKNESSFFFDRRIILDWRNHPDSNVSERSLDIIRPFGISTANYRSEISFDDGDKAEADKFLSSLNLNGKQPLIGLHVGAGKAPNRWSLDNYLSLISKLKQKFAPAFYLTGSKSDKEEIDYITKNSPVKIGLFINRTIPQVAALIHISDLFICNDTGIMHVAGTTDTPQVSVFGPTNPFNWAPIGENKIFIRKSELIDDVTVEEVFRVCEDLLTSGRKNTDV